MPSGKKGPVDVITITDEPVPVVREPVPVVREPVPVVRTLLRFRTRTRVKTDTDTDTDGFHNPATRDPAIYDWVKNKHSWPEAVPHYVMREKERLDSMATLYLLDKNLLRDINKAIGSLKASRYQRLDLIGAGGFGQIYSAFHKDATIVIKYQNAIGMHQTVNANGKKEWTEVMFLDKLGKFGNPLVPNFYEFFETDDALLSGFPTPVVGIVMSRVEGKDLAKYIHEFVVDSVQTFEIFGKMVDIVSKLYAMNIVHGDVKLDNFVWDDKKRKLTAVDLGAMHYIDPDDLRLPACSSCAPPEGLGLTGQNMTEEGALVWCLGLVLYILRVNHWPFTVKGSEIVDPGNVSLHIPPAVGGRFEDIITRMLAKSPDERATLADVKNWVDGYNVPTDGWYYKGERAIRPPISWRAVAGSGKTGKRGIPTTGKKMFANLTKKVMKYHMQGGWPVNAPGDIRRNADIFSDVPVPRA